MAIVNRDMLLVFWGSLAVTSETASSFMHHRNLAAVPQRELHVNFPVRFSSNYSSLSYCKTSLRGQFDGRSTSSVVRRHFVLSSRNSLRNGEPARFECRWSAAAMKCLGSDQMGGKREEDTGTECDVGITEFGTSDRTADRQTTRPGATGQLEKDVVLTDVKKTEILEKEMGSLGVGCDGAERDVQVHVEVVSWRESHITANVCVKASHQIMWEVLTDYERLAEFIPNLVRSERIISPHPGRIWLLQQGVRSAMYWHIEVRVVLDLEELPQAAEIRFFMVDGDLKRYNGRWYIRPGPRSGTIMLHYEVNVAPKFFFPAAFVERIIRADLPVNLRALVRRAETEPSEWKNLVELSKKSSERSAPLALQVFRKDKTWGWRNSFQMHRPFSVDEIHLRRLDDLLENGGGHRRVVATMTVEAPVKDVWKVLTDYECLSEFIPNLAISKIISRESNRVRILQEGCKCILCMVLHARVVLDLLEKLESEILFQQVEGDFNSLQGKWTLEPLGCQHTLLKYVVDIKMHKHCVLAEAIVEEVTYVDLPANLCAIRDRVELRHRDSLDGSSPVVTESKDLSTPEESKPITLMLPKVRAKRSRVDGLQKDFKVLERELLDFIKEHGREGYMPTRRDLRQHRRVDLEKSITRMGGFSIVATRLNLCQERKPRGYWDNFQNLRQEILLFQKESGMDSTCMPTRNALNKAGRHDVARALEKWGGVIEVARLMGLKARRVRLGSTTKILSTLVSTCMDDDFDALKPFKISLPAKPKKWVDMELSSGDKNPETFQNITSSKA